MAQRIPLLLAVVAGLVAAPPMRSQAVPLFHASGPMPSYEVATIKKADSNASGPGTRGQTIKSYILNAYGVSSLSQGQLVGGPAWLDTDQYVIQGKVSDDLRDAMQKMTRDEQRSQTLMLEESLLADRFKLKAHFETRDLPVYELTIAKGGVKFKEVPAPPPFVPGGPPPPPPAPGDAMRPGMINMQTKAGVSMLNARAASIRLLINLIRIAPDVAGRPILDKTGLVGNFDIVDLQWSGLAAVQPPTATDAALDAPSLATALEETLGLKLTETKAPVEVLVIDSIERPSEN